MQYYPLIKRLLLTPKMLHSNLGRILKELDKLEEAELSTRKVIELKPDFPSLPLYSHKEITELKTQ